MELIVVPLHDAIAEAGLDVIQSQAYYEGRYWNTTGIGRHVIVAGMIPELRKRGIAVIGHGATGRHDGVGAQCRLAALRDRDRVDDPNQRHRIRVPEQPGVARR
jgi:argininosuccinate synthase